MPYCALLLRQASECLRECVAIDNTRVPSLIGLGAVMATNEQYDRAAVMLKGALAQLDPQPVAEEEGEEGAEGEGKAAEPIEPAPNNQVSDNDTVVAYALLSVALERDEAPKKAGEALLKAEQTAAAADASADAAAVSVWFSVAVWP